MLWQNFLPMMHWPSCKKRFLAHRIRKHSNSTQGRFVQILFVFFGVSVLRSWGSTLHAKTQAQGQDGAVGEEVDFYFGFHHGSVSDWCFDQFFQGVPFLKFFLTGNWVTLNHRSLFKFPTNILYSVTCASSPPPKNSFSWGWSRRWSVAMTRASSRRYLRVSVDLGLGIVLGTIYPIPMKVCNPRAVEAIVVERRAK